MSKSETNISVPCVNHQWTMRNMAKVLDLSAFSLTTTELQDRRLNVGFSLWLQTTLDSNIALKLAIQDPQLRQGEVRMWFEKSQDAKRNFGPKTLPESNYSGTRFIEVGRFPKTNLEQWLTDDGDLILKCQLKFVETATKIEPKLAGVQKTNDKDQNGPRFEGNFMHLFESGEFSDINLKCSGVDFPCHKIILATRSTVFASMLRNPMKESLENEVTIKDMDSEVLKEMLEFMYSGTFDTAKKPIQLLMAAEQYDLQHLKSKCEKQLIEHLTIDNVTESLCLGEIISVPMLKEKALGFVQDIKEMKELTKLTSSDQFKKACEDFPSLMTEVLSAIKSQR